MADDYTGNYTGIAKGESLSAEKMTAVLNKMEKVANKTDALSNSSTEYPSSKAVYDAIQTINADAANINTALADKQDKIDAGTDSNIVAYSGETGKVKSLTRITSIGAAISASDERIPTEKAVAVALSDKANVGDLTSKADASDLTELENSVAGKQDKLTAEQLSLLNSLSSKLSTLSFFPKGTILPVAKSVWEEADNEFKKVWKVCDGDNGTINLIGKFLRGGKEADYGATGGTDSQTVAVPVPQHSHSITDPGHDHSYDTIVWNIDGGDIPVNSEDDDAHWKTGTTSKSVTGITKTDNAGTANASITVNTVPSYYTVIYIMKVA
jgi:hypothetical protein